MRMAAHSATICCRRAKWLPFRDSRQWAVAVLAVLGAAFGGASLGYAQTCEDRNPAHAAALIDKIRFSCEQDNIPYAADVYGLTAVADQEAIPALRRLADLPTNEGPGLRCIAWVMQARMALAKLGDEKYRAGLRIEEQSFIGDDRALVGLIEYLIAHAKDPSMIHNFGDYDSDEREGLLFQIDTIRRRRRVPDLPLADFSDMGVAQWKAYLEKHKGQQRTFPAYMEVADPYLRCLARRVDWAYADALLAIAANGGDEALPILRKFTPPWKPEMMGYVVAAPLNPNWSILQGNLQVALAQAGDAGAFQQIVAELNGGTAYESVRKLEYIGGRRAVDALVKALDLSEDDVQRARARQCGLQTYCYPDARMSWKSIWESDSYHAHIPRETCAGVNFHTCVAGVLGSMVENPPVSAGAQGTARNVEAWKEWWARNREKAEFTVKVEPTFE
jgi:hypothetical protein